MSAHSVEDIKRASAGLRGTLLASLADAVTGALRDDDQTLIKYHGSYSRTTATCAKRAASPSWNRPSVS